MREKVANVQRRGMATMGDEMAGVLQVCFHVALEGDKAAFSWEYFSLPKTPSYYPRAAYSLDGLAAESPFLLTSELFHYHVNRGYVVGTGEEGPPMLGTMQFWRGHWRWMQLPGFSGIRYEKETRGYSKVGCHCRSFV